MEEIEEINGELETYWKIDGKYFFVENRWHAGAEDHPMITTLDDHYFIKLAKQAINDYPRQTHFKLNKKLMVFKPDPTPGVWFHEIR